MSKGREYEVYFKLGAEMDRSVKTALGNTEKSLQDVEREFKGITASDPFRKVSQNADKADREVRDLDSSTGGFKETLKTVAEHVGAFALIQQGAEAVKNVFGTITEQEAAFDQIQAATGLTAKDMAQIEQTVGDLYMAGLGEGFNDLSAAVTATRQATQAQGEELENLTRKALIYKDVFGEDINESVRSADTLMRQFGLTTDEAYNLMAQGSQRGLNKTNELLDTINEFSPQFSILGFSANEMFDFFATGLDAGAWNLDKVGDLVKEFDNRIKDAGDAAAQDALADLFAPPDMDAFSKALMTGNKKTKEYLDLVKRTDKVTAATLVKNLQKGGKSGAGAMTALASIFGDSQKVLDGLSSGGLRGADALQQILAKLAEIDDPIEKQTIGIAILGTQYEDLGQKVTDALSTVGGEFDMAKATMDEIAAIKYENLATDWRQFGREMMTEFLIPMAEQVMPVLKDLAAWAADNKDLLKNMALVFGGATVAKGAINMTKSFGEMAKAATSAATGAGKAGGAMKAFGLASGLLGGPIGIAVTAVSAITMGVMEFKRRQEEARDALLNMGVNIEKAYGEYKSIISHADKVSALIDEYDQLHKVIKNAKTPTQELEAARLRMLDVEQELIALNPSILNAEDAKSGKFREQLGLVKDMNEIQRSMAKRELEKSFIDNSAKLPQLESEYAKMTANAEKYDEAFNKARESYSQFQGYVEQHQAIVNDLSLNPDQMNAQLYELARKIEEVTGSFYGNNWSNLIYDTSQFQKDYDKFYESWKTTSGEIDAANQSFKAIYDTSKAYIEMDLGGTIEEMAGKFGELSDAEKTAFTEALKKIEEVNRELDLLPDVHKVNVQVVYDQINGLSNIPNSVRNRYKIDEFADGGFANKASIFGEAGLEAAIPIDNRPRSHALLDRVNDIMGHDTGGGSTQVTFAPVVTINGGGDNAGQQVQQTLAAERAKFEQWYKSMMRQERRLAF